MRLVVVVELLVASTDFHARIFGTFVVYNTSNHLVNLKEKKKQKRRPVSSEVCLKNLSDTFSK